MRDQLRLTDQDQAALNGALGPLQSFAMSLIVQAANAGGARELTDVTFAHSDACHFNGQTHLDFARLLQKHGAKFAVPTWTNTLPISLLESDSRSQADPEFLSGAREVANIYKELGCSAVYTCAPYQLPGGPVAGQHIVGSESNAVSYYNSVVGARTQKYGDFLDVSCALLGRALWRAFTGTRAARPICCLISALYRKTPLIRKSLTICWAISWVVRRVIVFLRFKE